jgi:hypothetical protein
LVLVIPIFLVGAVVAVLDAVSDLPLLNAMI